jgi:hypothetical protein
LKSIKPPTDLFFTSSKKEEANAQLRRSNTTKVGCKCNGISGLHEDRSGSFIRLAMCHIEAKVFFQHTGKLADKSFS